MIKAFFNNDLAVGAAIHESSGISEDQETDSTTDSDASGEADSVDLLNMAELSPGFTENAYAIHVTQIVRNYAMQGRLDEALDFGSNELARSHNLRPDIAQGLQNTLYEAKSLRELSRDERDILRAENPGVRVDGPSFIHPSGALFASFDNAKAQPDPEMQPDMPIPRAPAPGQTTPVNSGPSAGAI